MLLLRFAILFLFAAFSIARASFDILVNGESIGSSTNITITYGDNDVLSVQMQNGAQNSEEWCWSENQSTLCLNTTTSYAPSLAENPSSSQTFDITISRKSDSESKTITLIIEPRPYYYVTFDADGGYPEPETQSVIKGGFAEEPQKPTKTNYGFEYWYYNNPNTAFSFATTPIMQNINLTAKWKINTYTVTFNSNGGSAVDSQTVEHGQTALKPNTDPTRAGYAFGGWNFDFDTPITSNIIISANEWMPNSYTITFNSQGGNVSPTTKEVTYSFAVGALPVPTKDGYDFDGWYTSSNGTGTKYTETTTYSTAGDITLYAQWTAKRYTITFNVNSSDGTVSPASKNVTYNEAIGTLPTPTREAYEFKGWFYNADGTGVQVTETIIYTTDGNSTIYAKWEFIKGTKPVASMLEYTIPDSSLTYNGMQIDEIAVTQKADVTGSLGTITVLYNNSSERPKNAGEYSISAFIAISAEYDSATISLGTLTIAKATVNLNVLSATAQDKEYDAANAATVTNIIFDESSLFGSDAVSQSDYSASARFVSVNAGTGVTVNLVINWLSTGPLYKNYNLSSESFSTSANITRATGILKISAPENYELLNPTSPTIISKNSFVLNSTIIWEYKMENDAAYSRTLPNKIGNWIVKATLRENSNYTGAVDSAYFTVTRGNSEMVAHTIEFTQEGFEIDNALSNSNTKYYVAGASLCEIKNATIQITVKEQDIILRIDKYNSKIVNEIFISDVNEINKYSISFGKPGLDTLVYTLFSTDGIYSESDTILIETPIPFDSVVKQKWNNVMFVNNNSETNDGYEFTDFKWFKNDAEIENGNLQFYSAGPSSKDTLNPEDIYKVTMQTASGIRISTCEGNPKSKVIATAAKPAITKQVMGINGKAAKNNNANVYNLKGSLIKKPSAGVYLVEENNAE